MVLIPPIPRSLLRASSFYSSTDSGLLQDRMKREDILLKIRQEASRFEPSSHLAPVRADDLLKYDDGEFIDILYRRVLKRQPDPAGKAHYLDLVKRLPKPLIIYFFSRSEEAKQKEIEIVRLYSASIRHYLKTTLASVKGSFSVVKKPFFRVCTLPSFHKAPEESKVDYPRFYHDFEEGFRGSEEEIERSVRVYLPLLQGTNDLIIDLGSGRGEWLRLLKKEGFDAQGVEINPYFLEECKEQALDVIKSDVFKFLKNAKSSSIGAITAFHLIEHVDPKKRLPFLKEIYRVLKPGGVLILETPNPRNILVSAGDFWRDPEHIAPVFPDTLSFMGKFVGFAEATCYFFNGGRTALIPCLDMKFEDLKDYVEISRDCALLARKS